MRGKGGYLFQPSKYLYRSIYTATWRWHPYTPIRISRRNPRKTTGGRRPRTGCENTQRGGRKLIVYIIQTSAAEAYVSRRHRESRRGSPERRGTGPRMHRALTTIDYGDGLEIQQDGNVRGALRLIHTYLKDYIFDRYVTKDGR